MIAKLTAFVSGEETKEKIGGLKIEQRSKNGFAWVSSDGQVSGGSWRERLCYYTSVDTHQNLQILFSFIKKKTQKKNVL